MQSSGVAGFAGFAVVVALGDEGERVVLLLHPVRTTCRGSAPPWSWSSRGEVFFGGEVDLGAVGGHADVVDVVALGDVVGDGVVDAHVEVAGLDAGRDSAASELVPQGGVGAGGEKPQGPMPPAAMRMWEPSAETAGMRRGSPA